MKLNHYLYLTVKDINTDDIGIVIDVDEKGVYVDFPKGVKYLKENEIKEIKEK